MDHPLQLRQYQRDALRVSKERFEKGVTRQLLALPTGTGKTCIFASLLDHHRFERSMLVLVHRKELATQAYNKIRAWNPNLDEEMVNIEMGQKICTGKEKVVIAGVQSIGRIDSVRIRKLPPDWFDVIVCDEAHHSAASTYFNVFNHFGLHSDDNKKLLLGVTATPFRTDERRLVPDGIYDGVYDELIYGMPILRALEEGWLCDLRSWRVEKTGTDLDSISKYRDDFAENQLGRIVNNRRRNGLVAREWKRLAPGRRTIVFAVTVDHARQLAAAFRDYCSVSAEAVWGDDPDRKAKLDAHREGKLQVLCNCQVLTESYDDWHVDCIVMARPTLSRVLFVQMIGRGTRIEEGISNLVEARLRGFPIAKPECIIIDFVDNTKKHDLVTFASLFNNNRDLGGKTLTEVAGETKLRLIPDPYLNPADLQRVGQIKTRVTPADLFRGARAPSSSAVWGDSFSFPAGASSSGYVVKAWESSPGFWKLEARNGGVLFRSSTARSKEEAQKKAQALCSIQGAPRARSPVALATCPYCHSRIRPAKLQKHKDSICPRRPSVVPSP